MQCKLPRADLDPGAEMSPSAGGLEQSLLGLFWLKLCSNDFRKGHLVPVLQTGTKVDTGSLCANRFCSGVIHCVLVVGERENGRARGRRARGEGSLPLPSRVFFSRARFFLCPLLPSACYAGYVLAAKLMFQTYISLGLVQFRTGVLGTYRRIRALLQKKVRLTTGGPVLRFHRTLHYTVCHPAASKY